MIIASAPGIAAESTCFGTPAHGRLENGVQLPREGRNFSSYSTVAAGLGRTYVHAKVHAIVVAAYSAVEQSMPGTVEGRCLGAA